MRVLLLNGPNLNLLGLRRPDVYGSTTLGELEESVIAWGSELGIDVVAFQSNHEGGLIDRIHAARTDVDAIVFNPGAFTHTSYALHDAIEAVDLPTIETHISNVKEREPWRARSVISPATDHQIYGRGIDGYRWALKAALAVVGWPSVRIEYGSEPDQFLRYRSTGGPNLAVMIHGGFWHHTWAYDTIELTAADLAARGWNVANIEYRRVGNGGGWPVTREDVIAAVESAAAEMGHLLDRMVLIGHSAGGQLALEAARHLDDLDVSAVVSMGGVNDMVEAITTGLGSGAANEYLDGADPVLNSPVHNPPRCPVIIAHGSADSEVPVSYGTRFAEAHGSELILTPDGDHYGFLDPVHPMWTGIVDAVS